MKINKSGPKTRKELRKEQRKQKKAKRHEFYTNRNKPKLSTERQTSNVGNSATKTSKSDRKKPSPVPEIKQVKSQELSPQMFIEKSREKEKRQQLQLENEMRKQRSKQLLEANKDEDKTIKRLEKLLNLNKRKSKSVPKSFATDGLDYLLEVCDSEGFKGSVIAEQNFQEANDEFDEDFALMAGHNSDSESQEKVDKSLKRKSTDNRPSKQTKRFKDDDSNSFGTNSDSEEDSIESDESVKDEELQDLPSEDDSVTNASDHDTESLASGQDSDGHDVEDVTSEDGGEEISLVEVDDSNTGKSTTWEDIYGRTRSQDGSVLPNNPGKYIPPAARLQSETQSNNTKRTEKLARLQKQLKGLLNRLAESNMHNISKQIEQLYMSNSRNDMNETLTSIILQSLVTNILSPERLLLEHVVLVTILHANIGSEIGGHFLQTTVDLLHKKLCETHIPSEDKSLDNLVVILCQLYNFKLFDSKLIYDILDKLVEQFDEKHVECILHVLRNVGFNLRKDDPMLLKNLIINVQKRASESTERFQGDPRLKFMLDILSAIKNNNVSKIPNYDTSYPEHLKKIAKGFVRKGNYVTQLNITLEDLLNVEARGRWWIVGSAWSGKSPVTTNEKATENAQQFSTKLLQLAKKHRMNTDVRKNIFCIIMSAEDYIDAFEKLLRLSLKTQEREIIHVILHCCMQEKKYNPYYAVLAQKFCEHDRKYQMMIKYSVWDRLKALNEQSVNQTSNLAKLLGHLFIEKGLPISTLKVMQFSELDKIALRFIRQILLGILLHENAETCMEVFEKVARSEKLKMFRESLRLFIHHFLLKNLNEKEVHEDRKKFLQDRAKLVERLLQNKAAF